MIVKPFTHARVLYQTADGEFDIAEPAITASVDNGGLLILSQVGREILVNAATIPELIRLLRVMRKDAQQGDRA